MSDMVSWLKEIYTKAMSNDFEWKLIYPNNMPCNGVTGIYTDMFFKHGDTYTYLKYSIQYCHRVDKEGFSHPEEPIKYYVLHELRCLDLPEIFEIPEPSNDYESNSIASIVNDFGRFRYIFDDEETAKSVVSNELLVLIYPSTYLLNEDDAKEWNAFLNSFNKGENGVE